jgi:hypothetical protein
MTWCCARVRFRGAPRKLAATFSAPPPKKREPLRRTGTHIRDNVVGYIALFFALTGVAWAAQIAPKNSVATKSIKKGAVTTAKLADGAVTGSKVAPGSLTAPNLAPGTLGGGITDLQAGTGLSGGGSSGTVTLSADQAVLQHRIDGGCTSGEAIQNVDQAGQASCTSFVRGSGREILLDNALTTGTSPVTVADLGFASFEVQCSDPAGGYRDDKTGGKGAGRWRDASALRRHRRCIVSPVVVTANSSMVLGQVSNGFGKVEFSLGNGGFPGAGSGAGSGTVYLNASYQNATGTCNELDFILSS